jgi:lipoprotein-anchoring transpeptidase ErfK/SrfK
MRRSFIVTAVLALSLTALAPVARAADPEPVAVAGVTIGGIPVAGLSKAQAVTAVSTAYTSGLVRVHAGSKLLKLPVKRMKVALPNLDAAADAAVLRTTPGDVLLSVTYSRPAMLAQVAKVARSVSRKAVNAHWGWKGRAPVAIAEHAGRALDRADLRVTLVAALRAPGHREIRAKLTKVRAKLSRAKLTPAITISRAGNNLHLYRFSKGKTVLWRRFGVATGQASFPSPKGLFRIIQMQRNPWWIPPASSWAKGAKPIPPGPGNPLGTRWMGISSPAVGIHGTPDAASIGYSASHGCIRMRIPDAEWLFKHVKIGTPVRIF